VDGLSLVPGPRGAVGLPDASQVLIAARSASPESGCAAKSARVFYRWRRAARE